MVKELWKVRKKDSGQIYSRIDFPTLKTWILEARIEPTDEVAPLESEKWLMAQYMPDLLPFFTPESLGADVISSQDLESFAQSSSRREEEVSFDLTPMIDIIFQLIIFLFLMASSVHSVHQIQIPKGKYGTPIQKEKIVISVDQNRRIFVNRSEVKLVELRAYLKEKVSQIILEGVIISADSKIDYGYFASVLDEIKGSGIKSVSLDVRPSKER